MDVDQVGIPHHVAMSLTVPERVTNDNIKSLTRRIVNGPAHIFGAENVITSNGITINLENCENREKIRLQYGWVVERCAPLRRTERGPRPRPDACCPTA